MTSSGPIAAGVDLALYSSHKFLGGPTGGHRPPPPRPRSRCVPAEQAGSAVAMKVGKEGVRRAHRGGWEAWSGATMPPSARANAGAGISGGTRCRGGPA